MQINLTGTVDNAQNPNITNAVVTRTGTESLTSATFNFTFHYDKDPTTAAVEDATAGGTLVFDKVADTYTFTLTDVIDGFSNDHPAHQRAPGQGTRPATLATPRSWWRGLPLTIRTRQRTRTSTSSSRPTPRRSASRRPAMSRTRADTTFNGAAPRHGAAASRPGSRQRKAPTALLGDTIQKGEALTLRFFNSDMSR